MDSGETKENPGKSKIWELKRQERLVVVTTTIIINAKKRRKTVIGT
jgi:hypothetical protein